MAEKMDAEMGRVLLADDDELFRRSVATMVRREGYECVEAADAMEARKLLAESEFDTLMSDIGMPGNLGLELIQDIPQITEGLPIILLTGQPTVETAIKSVSLKVVAYLLKPPDFTELRALLRQCVSDYRYQRTLTSNRQRLKEWDQELEEMQVQLRRTRTTRQEEALTGYWQVTLRNLMIQLADLEKSTSAASKFADSSADMEKLDLIGALQRTIEVLEKTRSHFKSKDLGELRRQLEALLKSRE